MARKSAGIVLYRVVDDTFQVFLGHMGGPFWKNKDNGAWSFPKGEFQDEDALRAAIREFREETGHDVNGPFVELTPCRQAGGKLVQAWAAEGDVDATAVVSNTFTLEWPPKSGRLEQFPEMDRADWFDLDEARRRITPGLVPILDELAATLGEGRGLTRRE